MPKNAKLSLLALSVVLLLFLFLGVNWHGVQAASEGQEGAYRQINVYGEVLQHIQNDYVEEPSIGKVTRGALRGMMESLDPDSSFLAPADYKTFKGGNSGKAQVGLNVSKRYGYATVVSVVPGSPADKADLNDGDIIEAIETKDTRDLSLAMIRLMLQGAPGTELKLAVLRPRNSKPDKVTLNRVVVTAPPVTETMYENSSILYLKPAELDHDHVSQVEARLKAMNKSTTKKILLDLRDVAEGDQSEGLRLANLFVAKGTLATLEGQKVAKQVFAAEPAKAVDTNSSLVVLVNRGTYGAAELAAAAIADNKRGELVGERTFGEGSQQKTFELPDGSALIMSVAKYASPAGKKFEDEGVTPATVVALAQEEAPASGGDDTAAASTPHVKKNSGPDEQLNKALEMLKAKAV